MVELLKVMVICFTVVAVLLPIAFLVAISMPANSEFRHICLRVCYWGVVLLAIGYFAFPIDVIPDVFFPIGFADDLVVLGIGYAHARKAMKPLAS